MTSASFEGLVVDAAKYAVFELNKLAEACRQAKEGSPKLNTQIGILLDFQPKIITRFKREDLFGMVSTGNDDLCQTSERQIKKWPDFSRSFDAARLLVPANYAITDLMIWPGLKSSLVLKGTRYEPVIGMRDGGYYYHKSAFGIWKEVAATHTLALCAACIQCTSDSISKLGVKL